MAPAELPKQAASLIYQSPWEILAGSGSFLRCARPVCGGRELSLEGQARGVKGSLSMAMSAAKQADCAGWSFPAENALQKRRSRRSGVIPVSSLSKRRIF